MVWFHSFKVNIITGQLHDIVTAKLTHVSIDNRRPDHELSKGLLDKLYVAKSLYH